MEKDRTLRNVLLLEKKRKIGGGIYHKMQVDFAYNSNHSREASSLTSRQGTSSKHTALMELPL